MSRTMILLNATGDITIGWSEADDASMIPMIEKKLREGYSFFIVQGEEQVRLQRVDQIGDARTVVMADRDAEQLFAAGKVGLVQKAQRVANRIIDTLRRSRNPAEIARENTVVMRPMAGG